MFSRIFDYFDFIKITDSVSQTKPVNQILIIYFHAIELSINLNLQVRQILIICFDLN